MSFLGSSPRHTMMRTLLHYIRGAQCGDMILIPSHLLQSCWLWIFIWFLVASPIHVARASDLYFRQDKWARPSPPLPLHTTSQLYNKPENKREFHSCAICACLIWPILCIINVHFFQGWIFFFSFSHPPEHTRGGYIGQRPRCLISNSPLPGY